MFEFWVSLREKSPPLLALLSHYAQAAAEDRTMWQPRLMQMDGIDSKQLTSLHGDLIAHNGIEPNAGQIIFCQDGIPSPSYRITHCGLREYRRIQGIEIEEISETPERPLPRVLRRKKVKDEALAAATADERKQESLGHPCFSLSPQ
jgi:hypothetical protein